MCASERLATGASGKVEPPTVVNVKRHAYDQYIGRAVYCGRRRHVISALNATSIYANPYMVGRDGSRAAVLVEYEKLWRSRLGGREQDIWFKRLRVLAGKRLGCWCKPKPCHGDVLVKLFRELFCGDDDETQPDTRRLALP